MSYFYYVIGQKENAGEINTPVKISESNNLYSVFSGLKNIIYIHQCKTQKGAVELAISKLYLSENDKKEALYNANCEKLYNLTDTINIVFI